MNGLYARNVKCAMKRNFTMQIDVMFLNDYYWYDI